LLDCFGSANGFSVCRARTLDLKHPLYRSFDVTKPNCSIGCYLDYSHLGV